MVPQTEIETPRLLLRRWGEGDLDEFIRMNADPAVMRYFPERYSIETSKSVYEMIQEEFAQSGYGLYVAEEKESGSFMGHIGFHRADFEVDFCPCIEIGWRLNKRFWRQGYATEGAKACLEHGFQRLGFTEIISFTAEINQPSQRVMQKIGMGLKCHFEHPRIQIGHPVRPHVCYCIRNDSQ